MAVEKIAARGRWTKTASVKNAAAGQYRPSVLIDFALYWGRYKRNLRRRQDFFIKTTKDTRLDAVVDFRLKILLLSFW
jgi:hypothetical protein